MHARSSMGFRSSLTLLLTVNGCRNGGARCNPIIHHNHRPAHNGLSDPVSPIERFPPGELGLSRPAAAKALGLCERTVSSYAHSRRKLPRWLELAVKGLVAERQTAQA